MKKAMLTLALIGLGAGAWAQKSKIRTAREYLDEKNYKKAIVAIDEAVNNEDTKNNADAWYWRGMAYLQQALDSAAKSPESYNEAITSFMKTVSINPAYGEEINNPFYSTAILSFNAGVADFTAKNYGGAYQKFMRVNEIYKVNGGKRYEKNAEFKNLAENARLNAAYAALNNHQDDQALALLQEIKGAGTVKDSNVYQSIIEIYQRQNKDAELIGAINDARVQFPGSQLFRNLELNYYIASGKQAELMPKLEEAVQKAPNDPEFLFNLANGYEKMAYPTDAQGKDLPGPANQKEIVAKAETAYLNALRLKDNMPDYNYNLAILYYKAAASYNRQLGEIKGMSAAEQKRYDQILALRDAQFDKALPYFEKAYNQLDQNAASLKEGEKITYKNSMIGLREIYSRKNNKAKTEELKKKIDALK